MSPHISCPTDKCRYHTCRTGRVTHHCGTAAEMRETVRDQLPTFTFTLHPLPFTSLYLSTTKNTGPTICPHLLAPPCSPTRADQVEKGVQHWLPNSVLAALSRQLRFAPPQTVRLFSGLWFSHSVSVVRSVSNSQDVFNFHNLYLHDSSDMEIELDVYCDELSHVFILRFWL